MREHTWEADHKDLSVAASRRAVFDEAHWENRDERLRLSQSTVLSWEDFTVESAYFDLVEDTPQEKYDNSKICQENYRKYLDLRHYMVETPFVVNTTDKLQKVLDLFRHMQLRHLPVLNPVDGCLVGIITRHDLFPYMSYEKRRPAARSSIFD